MRIGDQARVRFKRDTGFEMQCPRCRDLKRESYWPLTTEFWATYNLTMCKACVLTGRRLALARARAPERQVQWYERNRDRLNARRRERYAENPERTKAYHVAWRKRHLESRLDYERQWRADRKRLAA